MKMKTIQSPYTLIEVITTGLNCSSLAISNDEESEALEWAVWEEYENSVVACL